MDFKSATDQQENQVRAESSKAKYFRWGVFLTWVPFLIVMLSVGDIGSPTHSSIAGMARTLFYGIPLLGFGLVFGLEVAALALLVRGFARGDILHYVLYFLSIACSVALTLFFGGILAVIFLALMLV